MALSDLAIRNAKTRDKPYNLAVFSHQALEGFGRVLIETLSQHIMPDPSRTVSPIRLHEVRTYDGTRHFVLTGPCTLWPRQTCVEPAS